MTTNQAIPIDVAASAVATWGHSRPGSGHIENTSCDLSETGCSVSDFPSERPWLQVRDEVEALTKGKSH